MLLLRTFCVFSWPIRHRNISLFILVPKMQARAWTVHVGLYYFMSVSTPRQMIYTSFCIFPDPLLYYDLYRLQVIDLFIVIKETG